MNCAVLHAGFPIIDRNLNYENTSENASTDSIFVLDLPLIDKTVWYNMKTPVMRFWLRCGVLTFAIGSEMPINKYVGRRTGVGRGCGDASWINTFQKKKKLQLSIVPDWYRKPSEMQCLLIHHALNHALKISDI